MRHFFQVYKTLENDKVTTVTEINGCDDAKEVIRKSIDSYIRDFQMA
ncbi:MAG: inorganic diphosphatase [Ruminococcus sp.]|nr:inorganic diphosphatase [Ruminococcus sp.]MDD6532131.1 inorganic diphosphatase [Ruminococcus sp.]